MAGVKFEEDTAFWLIDQGRAVERGAAPPADRVGRDRPVLPTRTELLEARVTDATPDGEGYYPAVIVRGAEDFAEVRLEVEAGATVEVDGVYFVNPTRAETDAGFRLYKVVNPDPADGTSTITVKEVDGSPSGTTGKVQFDSFAGVALQTAAIYGASDTAGYVVYLLPASITQNGMVNTSHQVFTGTKEFHQDVRVQSGEWDSDNSSYIDLIGGQDTGLPTNITLYSASVDYDFGGAQPYISLTHTTTTTLPDGALSGACFWLDGLADSVSGAVRTPAIKFMIGGTSPGDESGLTNFGEFLLWTDIENGLSEFEIQGPAQSTRTSRYVCWQGGVRKVGATGTLGDGSTVNGGIITNIAGGGSGLADALDALGGITATF